MWMRRNCNPPRPRHRRERPRQARRRRRRRRRPLDSEHCRPTVKDSMDGANPAKVGRIWAEVATLVILLELAALIVLVILLVLAILLFILVLDVDDRLIVA